MAAPAARVVIGEPAFRAAENLLTQIPLELRTAIVPKAIRAAARPVVNAAQSLAPDSVVSGSRKKWSKKVRDARVGVKQHKETIGISSVRQYGETIAIYVGALWPAGVLVNVIGHDHKMIQWGKNSGWIRHGHRYLKDAGEQTAPQQQSEFVAAVRTNVEQVLRKLYSGRGGGP